LPYSISSLDFWKPSKNRLAQHTTYLTDGKLQFRKLTELRSGLSGV
jgi:hypothetical protein